MTINSGTATRILGGIGTAGVVLALLAGTTAPALAIGLTTWVSVRPEGSPDFGNSGTPAISANGRYVAFYSGVPNLVPGDTNGRGDVFVRDLQTSTTARVSLGARGAQANDDSGGPLAISADGRFVAFSSLATNLVAGDTNGMNDVFVRDRQTSTTTRVSVGPGGAQADCCSAQPTISSDGRFVTFSSLATNLVPSDTNDERDIFVHDLGKKTTARLSTGPGGVQADGSSGMGWGPVVSGDGHAVAYDSYAKNLVAGATSLLLDVFVTTR